MEARNISFFRSAAEDPESQPSRVKSKILWLQTIFELFNQWRVSAQFSAPMAITFKYVMRSFLLPKCVPLTLMRIPSPITLPLGRLCSSHPAREPSEQGTLSDSVFSTVSRTLARISVKNNSRNRMSPSCTKNSFQARMSGFRPAVTNQMGSNIAFPEFPQQSQLTSETPTLVTSEDLEHWLREGDSPSGQGSAFWMELRAN